MRAGCVAYGPFSILVRSIPRACPLGRRSEKSSLHVTRLFSAISVQPSAFLYAIPWRTLLLLRSTGVNFWPNLKGFMYHSKNKIYAQEN